MIDFIETVATQKAKKLIERRIRNKRSSMILGEFGSGKSRLLHEIMKEHKEDSVYLTGLGSVTQIIAECVGETNKIHYTKKNDYMARMRRYPKKIFIDEAQHLPVGVIPYFKLFIEHGNIFILAGLPSLKELMEDSKNADVLSRFMRITITPLKQKDLEASLKDFEPKAIKLIHGRAESTRVMIETIEDCRDYARENGIAMITEDMAEKIFYGEL